jgi:hypothetical protein
MKKILTNLIMVGMAVTFFLLAVQAEPVTAFLGYSFGAIFVLALISSTISDLRGKNDA